MHTTVFQAEIIAINEACKTFISTKQSNMQYIKIFSDSQAAILALNSNTITSSLVKQTIISLNSLADNTKSVEICWIVNVPCVRGGGGFHVSLRADAAA